MVIVYVVLLKMKNWRDEFLMNIVFLFIGSISFTTNPDELKNVAVSVSAAPSEWRCGENMSQS